MSNLSTFAEVGLVDARESAGTLIIPNTCDIPGRVITFKDQYGACRNSTIALLTSTGDVFEDGTTYRTLANPYDFITIYAASTNIWSVIGGTQVNAFRASIMSNSSNFTSSLQANTLNSAVTFTSFLYPQTGLSNTVTSNLVPPVNAITSGASIGQISSNYFQTFTVSTITRNLVSGISPATAITVGASIIPAYSTNIISNISLGNPTNRFFQGFFVSTITSSINADVVSSFAVDTSTITSGTMTLDRLFNGPIATATTTQNLYPFTAGALVGFGSNTSQNGYYAEGHFRSTFTQLIQPTLDADIYSNVVFIRGNVSTQNQVVSSITMNTATGVTLSMSTLTTNALTLGSGGGFASIPFIQSVLVSTIQINNSQLNTSNITLSTVNRKLYPYISTLGIPPSTFSLSGTLASNITSPLVLYSNVAFPHAGFFNFTQSAIFSRTSDTANIPQASIFYTPGIYPSTLSNIDAYSSLPYLGNANASSFTTLSEIMYVSTTQLTRNIIYSDQTGNSYTANLFMSPITIQYVPNNSLIPE